MDWKVLMIDQTNINSIIQLLLTHVNNPNQGLPQEIFYLISQLTPLINVDLLIKNSGGETLLTWREDEFYGPGWHIPGGIIRYKESSVERITKVANLELNVNVNLVHQEPVFFREIIAKNNKIRGHFISFLYHCSIIGSLDRNKQAHNINDAQNGQWMWHSCAPDNLIIQHRDYTSFINT